MEQKENKTTEGSNAGLASKYPGNDNYGRPKSAYIEKLEAMSDEEIESETYSMIYQAARCANNPKADWHWMVDVCWDVCKSRPNDIYKKAYDECYRGHAG